MDAARFALTDCSYDDVRRLQRELGVSEAMAWVLVRRGFADAASARTILDPDAGLGPEQFHDPLLLGDMAAAVERIEYAIEQREPIMVHGDYDADGVCSTTLLVEALESLGADVSAFLPSRFANGYGLHLDSVDRFAAHGIRLLITVDCGITAVEPVAQAVDRGMDVIICDHHEPLPDGALPAAIICSARPSDYPFPEICATVVAGKLVQALGAPYGDAQHELEAIATIADVMPLINENRAIVRRGLLAMRRTERPGLRALMSASDVHAPSATEEDVGFRIAPRLNAVGRLGESERAYELLRAETSETAQRLAAVLHETNNERKTIETEIVAQAVAQVDSWTDEQRAARAYVVSAPAWHEGVVGIVAARLADRYHRPVVVISELEPLSRGSGRSIDGFDLHAAFVACEHLLVRCGGHRAAAGLTLETDRIPALRAALAAYADANLTEADLIPKMQVDAVVAGDEVSIALVEELQQLAPFGNANPRPRLLAVGAKMTDLQLVGGDRHLRGTLLVGGVGAQAIGFGHGRHLHAIRSAEHLDACIRVGINRFRGVESLQIEIDRLIPIPVGPPHVAGFCAVRCHYKCDNRVGLPDVLAASTRPDPVVAAAMERPPRLEPLLARADCTDLRNAGRSVTHVARLATAGLTQLVVCADVSRRRDLLEGPLHPQRFGIAAAALASERCNPIGIAARLRTISQASGPRLVFADYGALHHVLRSGIRWDAVVVLDPPVTDDQRDLLAGAASPLHLVFGAAETRFAYAVAGAVQDARSTLRSSWKLLKQGSMAGRMLEHTLFGHEDDPYLHSPAAVANALRELRSRGLASIDAAAGRVTPAGAVDPSAEPAPLQQITLL